MPVHCMSNADSAELFVNGKSQGLLTRSSASSYRFHWDNVTYEDGEISVVTFKNGQSQPWASARRQTAGHATAVQLTVDRSSIMADGYDLAYITATVVDANGIMVPRAKQHYFLGVGQQRGSHCGHG
jgi:beta-galactosidase